MAALPGTKPATQRAKLHHGAESTEGPMSSSSCDIGRTIFAVRFSVRAFSRCALSHCLGARFRGILRSSTGKRSPHPPTLAPRQAPPPTAGPFICEDQAMQNEPTNSIGLVLLRDIAFGCGQQLFGFRRAHA
jgi:hypothetical protein